MKLATTIERYGQQIDVDVEAFTHKVVNGQVIWELLRAARDKANKVYVLSNEEYERIMKILEGD